MVESIAAGSDGALPGGGDFGDRERDANTPSSAAPQAVRLRPYQIAVIAKIEAEIAAGRRRVLMVAPTAAGKTVIAAAMVRAAADRGERVLFLDNRRELTAQTSRRFYDVGIDAGIIQAGFAARPGAAVQIASVATLHARAVRSRSLELPPADLVIIDEAHHVRARTYRTILDRYPSAIIIGMTATPCRGDGRGLGNVFDALVESATVAELQAAEWLVRARIYAPSQPDLTGVRVERGDYVERQLAERVDTASLVGDVVEHWLRLAERRRTVCFATGVAHSVHIRDEFRRAGVMAEHISGATPIAERDAILARLDRGEVEVVTNAMVLVEGWDQPAVSCLVLARPTKSLGLYRQMVGRVLRPAPGKADALILDHAGAVFAHGFPDDPIKWTLDQGKRAENKAHSARGQHRAPSLTSCSECAAVRFQGQPCVVCGWQPRPKAEPIPVRAGELGQVDRSSRSVTAPVHDAPARDRFHRGLIWIAQERGYKSGWVAHKFKEKFGIWPPRHHAGPLPPDDALRAWVRSRAIAFAKARAGQ
ncbi:MAG TPA: DEAD/DEAH box helicase [Stellaceae bacterium]